MLIGDEMGLVGAACELAWAHDCALCQERKAVSPLRPSSAAMQGKTVQAIAVAAAYRDEWPLLVIAPSSLRGVPSSAALHPASVPALLW